MKKEIFVLSIIFATMLTHTSCNKAPETINPLTVESTAPFGAPEFDKYKTSDFLPAFEQGIAEKMAEIQKIIDCKEAPT